MKPTRFQKLLLEEMAETEPWEASCCNADETQSLQAMEKKEWAERLNIEGIPHWKRTTKGRHIVEEKSSDA